MLKLIDNEKMVQLISTFKKRIKATNISQRSVAKEIGMHYIYLNKLVNLQLPNPRLRTIKKVERFLRSKGV